MSILPSASTIAPEVDAIAIVWLAFSVAVLCLVFGMIVGFVLKYGGKQEAVPKLPKRSRSSLEWSWTIALTVIALGIGFWADKIYFRMHLPPRDSTPVYVVAKQWMWKFQHEDGNRELNELHVPVGEPIKLVMSSEDVIHSFYVPAFRIKQDVLPGRYTYIWFQATKPGVYRLLCAEFCGTSHATMGGRVIAMPSADYEAWKSTSLSGRAGESGSNLASRGRELFTTLGCVSCHNEVGRAPDKIAPPLEGLYMSRVGMRTGESVIADENYLRESILNPNAKIVEGYQAVMPSFQGQVSEEDLLSLIAYIKSLQYSDRSKL